jgi:hypothetical protein
MTAIGVHDASLGRQRTVELRISRGASVYPLKSTRTGKK